MAACKNSPNLRNFLLFQDATECLYGNNYSGGVVGEGGAITKYLKSACINSYTFRYKQRVNLDYSSRGRCRFKVFIVDAVSS